MDSQIAQNTLYKSEQFAVGGYHSVRGFRENYITGDSGYYFRNKASVNLGLLMSLILTEKTPNNSNNQNFIIKNLHYLNKIKLEPFYDYGHVRTSYNGDKGRLSGMGIKSIFESKYFNASLIYSQALQKSKLITSQKKKTS